MLQYSLYIEHAREIPLYESGSLGSFIADLGMGFIIHLPQIEGITPLLKHILKSECKNKTEVLFFSDSTCILSIPQAFPSLASLITVITSRILIPSLNRGSFTVSDSSAIICVLHHFY